MSKIELNADEIQVIQQQQRGEFDTFSATDYQKQHLMSVIDKADALMEELDAYEESGDDVIAWFWAKYQAQQANA